MLAEIDTGALLRRMIRLLVLIAAPILMAAQPTASPTPQPPMEFNTAVFESTFKLYEPVKNGTCGTAFLLVKPKKPGSSEGWWVLVTGAHVLEGIAGDSAILVMRSYTGGVWNRIPFPFRVRNAGKALWVKHPTADVAAMYISIPIELAPQLSIGTSLLATDQEFSEYDVHPGDQLFALGFPFCVEGNFGFPVLRTGALASFPLVPSRSVHSFLFDFSVFEGNSGSPVYLYSPSRTIRGNSTTTTVQMVVGLVSAQSVRPELSATMASSGTGALLAASPSATPTLAVHETTRSSLALAIVVPSSLIFDTIKMLPPSP
jgi:hypothetical protein